MKKSLFILMVVLLVSVPLATAQHDEVVLTHLVFETPNLNAEFWDNSIKAALASLPDYIKVEKITSPTLDRTAYAKQLLATGQFPDVLQSINTVEFIEAGLLLPYDNAWAEENFILPYGNSIGGNIWQAPTNSQIIPFVYYNKAIFEEVGVEPPTTWDEFLAVAQAIKDAGHVPIAMCGAELWCGSFPMIGIITADVVGDNPDWILQRYDGEVHFSDPDFVAAVQKYNELVDKGYIDEGALGMDYASTNQQFLDGDAAMYFMGSWFIASVPEDHPFEVGAFLIPRNDGKVVIPFNVGGGVHVSALSKHPEEAMMYAQAWALAPANLLALIEGDAAFPMLKGLTMEDYGADVSDLFMEGYDYVLDDEGFKVNSFSWTTNDYSLLLGMNDELWKSYQSIFLGADVEDEMKRLDDLWDETAERSDR